VTRASRRVRSSTPTTVAGTGGVFFGTVNTTVVGGAKMVVIPSRATSSTNWSSALTTRKLG
jgi:hypothetical protein